MESINQPLSIVDRQQITRIQLITRRLLRGIVSGNAVTKQRGYGLEFDQLREYDSGDDIRFIDWNASARSGSLMIKQYLQDHTKTVIIALDISASGLFGSGNKTIFDLGRQAALVIATVAEYTRAQCGLLLFADTVMEFIPPGMGPKRIYAVIKKIVQSMPAARTTSLTSLFKRLVQLKRTDTLAFVISDFIDNNFEGSLAYAAASYDIIAIRLIDRLEYAIPLHGRIHLQDTENGGKFFLLKNRQQIEDQLKQRFEKQQELFRRYKVSLIDVGVEDKIIDKLVVFFARRLRADF